MNKWHLLSLIFLCNATNAFTWREFGRWDHIEQPRWTRKRIPVLETASIRDLESINQDKARIQKKAREIERIIQDLEEVMDASNEILNLSLSLSMSMSVIGKPSTPPNSFTLSPVSTLIPSTSVSLPPTSTTSITLPPTPMAVPSPSVTSPPTPTTIPSASVTLPPTPTAVPSPSVTLPFTPTVIPSPSDTLAPTLTTAPTLTNASNVPSNAPSASLEAPSVLIETADPTIADDNSTEVPTADTPVFTCDDNGSITLGSTNAEGSTLVFLVVGYKVESSSNSTADIEDDLEELLFETAVLATLGGCNSSVNDRRHALEMEDEVSSHPYRHLLVETLAVGPCDGILNETESCTILETEILFYVKGSIDPDVAAFVSYSAIEEHMAQDRYIGMVPTVLLLEYLSPLPLVPPPSFPGNASDGTGGVNGGDSPSALQSTAATDRLSISPWTIGACVATIMGGIISLLVYSRNRQARERHGGQVRHRYQSSNMERSVQSPISI